jgi:hypothetical protein
MLFPALFLLIDAKELLDALFISVYKVPQFVELPHQLLLFSVLIIRMATILFVIDLVALPIFLQLLLQDVHLASELLQECGQVIVGDLFFMVCLTNLAAIECYHLLDFPAQARVPPGLLCVCGFQVVDLVIIDGVLVLA